MYGLKEDWILEERPRHFVIDDYIGLEARWCPGCGGHSMLGAVHRLCRDKQLPPEKTVSVSGIGCSSRFPHYMKTYGFHSLHGRALPVACGIKSRRPDLKVFVSTGDGDCCAIGTSHWIHAVRYNMDMVVILFDNMTYGLTKMQTSPTTPKGEFSNTHPYGALLNPIEPLPVVLGITNVSFVARTVDWNPPHMYETIKTAYEHPGFSFIQVLQRCPHYKPNIWNWVKDDPEIPFLLTHPNGISSEGAIGKAFKYHEEHDPSDLAAARQLASMRDRIPVGLFYQNKNVERYDEMSAVGIGLSNEAKLEALEAELDKFVV